MSTHLRHAWAMRIAGAKPKTVTLDWILSSVKPNDDPTWAMTFKYIEENHQAEFPENWDAYHASIAKGIRTPVVILDEGGKLSLWSGHHRVWSAHRQNIKTIPAIITTDPEEANRLLLQQSDNEDDWR